MRNEGLRQRHHRDRDARRDPEVLISYRTGDMWSPKVDDTEALQTEVGHFIACVEGREQPLTGGEQGLTIVRLLEAADASMRKRGAPVDF